MKKRRAKDDGAKMMRRAFRFRCYPNKGTRRRAIEKMLVMAQVWNAGLEERQRTYRESKENPKVKAVNSYYRQYHLIRKREHPEYADFNAQSLQDVLAKLHGSYRSFFALIKKDPKARPPGEKKIHRCLTYRQSGWRLEGNSLYLTHIGRFKLRLHRPIEGKIKTVSITLNHGKWYACFSCEMARCMKAGPASQREVRITFEDHIFLRDSQGNVIEQPQFYFSDIGELRRLSRSLSRKRAGSRNRWKAKKILRDWHERIANRRRAFLWQIANAYAGVYDTIYIPEMPLKERIMHATTSRAAMKLCDAAYGIFAAMLMQKAEENGAKVVEYAL